MAEIENREAATVGTQQEGTFQSHSDVILCTGRLVSWSVRVFYCNVSPSHGVGWYIRA